MSRSSWFPRFQRAYPLAWVYRCSCLGQVPAPAALDAFLSVHETAGADRVVRLTSTASGRVLRTLEGAHSQGVCDVAWTCDGSYLASASDDATIALWDVATGKPACKAFKGHTNYVFCADFSPRCNILASGSYDESLRIWDVRSGKCIRVIPAHSEPVTSVQFNGDGTVLATGSYDGLV